MPAENRVPSVGQWNPGGDWILEALTILLPVKGAGILVSKCSCYFWTPGSSFFLPLKLLGISEASPFLFFFFPPSKVLFLLWCFQMFRLQFFRLWKKKSVLMHLRLPLDSQFAQRFPKIAPEAVLILRTGFLFSRSIDWGYVAIFRGKAVWFSLLADVSGGRLLFIIMKSIAVWCQRPPVSGEK